MAESGGVVGSNPAAPTKSPAQRRDYETCQICGAWGRTVDHIIPRHLGRAVRDMTNARVRCRLRNLFKGGSLMSNADVLAGRRARGDGSQGPGATYGQPKCLVRRRTVERGIWSRCPAPAVHTLGSDGGR